VIIRHFLPLLFTLRLPQVLVGAAGISLLAAVVILTVLSVIGYHLNPQNLLTELHQMSAYKALRTPSENHFMRTHLMAYFISLLLCDTISGMPSFPIRF